MITFLNFDKQRMQETNGFQRKVSKVATQLEVSKCLYTEILNVEKSSIDVLIIGETIIGETMRFHRVHLYSEKVINMLNDEFSKLVSSLGLSSEETVPTSEFIETFNLIDEIQSMLSRSIELLNIENTYNIDQLENISSSEFHVSLENFSYSDLYKAMDPLVRNFIPLTYSFKILNLTKNSIEVLVVTKDCKLYQYTIFLDIDYTRFFNRYISAVLPYEKFAEMKINLKDADFSESLYAVEPIYCTEKRKLNICEFLSFLIKKCQKDMSEEGYKSEGLKNVYKFFLSITENEDAAKKLVLANFRQAKTYDVKSTISDEESTTSTFDIDAYMDAANLEI